MKDVRVAVFAVVLSLGPAACGEPAAGSAGGGAPLSSAAAAAPGARAPATAGAPAAPRQSLALLAPGERRVALVVLPGDALVEVNTVPVRRRNGVVDLVGKVGDTFSVRARKGEKSTAVKVVTLQESGASPAFVDLDEPAPQVTEKPAKAAAARFSFDD